MIPKSNVDLFHHCAAGPDGMDSLYWELFVQAYGRLLRASIRSTFYRCGATFSKEDVEEAQQEVYCRLLEKGRRCLRRFRGRRESQARCFLRRIAGSVVIDLLRRGSAQKRGGEMLEEVAYGPADSGEPPCLSDQGSPEVEMLRREHHRQLLRRCRRIAARSAHGRRNLRILHLAIVEGRSSRDIVRSLGLKLSVSAVDTVLHRMRRDLADDGLHLPARRLGSESPIP